MIWQLVESLIDLARPALQVLTRDHAADLAVEMGDCQKDKDVLGCEIWRNRTELVWFVKCTVCPGAGALCPSRITAEQWAMHHWQSVQEPANRALGSPAD